MAASVAYVFRFFDKISGNHLGPLRVILLEINPTGLFFYFSWLLQETFYHFSFSFFCMLLWLKDDSCALHPLIDRRRSATLIRPGEAIPFGGPYRTHLNGPRKLLTARKRVRPLPARRLSSSSLWFGCAMEAGSFGNLQLNVSTQIGVNPHEEAPRRRPQDARVDTEEVFRLMPALESTAEAGDGIDRIVGSRDLLRRTVERADQLIASWRQARMA
ncbi:hypothetical protein Tco_0168717 [Tanacetum coccineum]